MFHVWGDSFLKVKTHFCRATVLLLKDVSDVIVSSYGRENRGAERKRELPRVSQVWEKPMLELRLLTPHVRFYSESC